MSAIDTQNKEVMLGDEKKVPYDILVLSTGCKARAEGPSKLWELTKQQAQQEFNAVNEKVAYAAQIHSRIMQMVECTTKK